MTNILLWVKVFIINLFTGKTHTEHNYFKFIILKHVLFSMIIFFLYILLAISINNLDVFIAGAIFSPVFGLVLYFGFFYRYDRDIKLLFDTDYNYDFVKDKKYMAILSSRLRYNIIAPNISISLPLPIKFYSPRRSKFEYLYGGYTYEQ